jgi:hypothetical protein
VSSAAVARAAPGLQRRGAARRRHHRLAGPHRTGPPTHGRSRPNEPGLPARPHRHAPHGRHRSRGRSGRRLPDRRGRRRLPDRRDRRLPDRRDRRLPPALHHGLPHHQPNRRVRRHRHGADRRRDVEVGRRRPGGDGPRSGQQAWRTILSVAVRRQRRAENGLEPPQRRGLEQVRDRRRPTLPGTHVPSTIGAGGLNFRVRDGNGWDPSAMATETCCQRAQPIGRCSLKNSIASTNMVVAPSPRPISTGRLNTLLCVHLRPINVMVCHGPYLVDPVGNLILERASHLDAFSAYPFRRSLTSRALGRTTGTRELRPSRSSRTRDSLPQVSYGCSG